MVKGFNEAWHNSGRKESEISIRYQYEACSGVGAASSRPLRESVNNEKREANPHPVHSCGFASRAPDIPACAAGTLDERPRGVSACGELILKSNRNQTIFAAGFEPYFVAFLDHISPLCSAEGALSGTNPSRKSLSSSY